MEYKVRNIVYSGCVELQDVEYQMEKSTLDEMNTFFKRNEVTIYLSTLKQDELKVLSVYLTESSKWHMTAFEIVKKYGLKWSNKPENPYWIEDGVVNKDFEVWYLDRIKFDKYETIQESIEINAELFSRNKKDISFLDIIMERNENMDITNPLKFPGIVIRLVNPKSTLLLFKTGKFVSVGLKKFANRDKVKKKVINLFKKTDININTETIDMQLKNIALTGEIPVLYSPDNADADDVIIDLNALTLFLENCQYEPEIFPGLIHTMMKNDIFGKKKKMAIFLVFSSRRVVCVGIQKREEIENILSTFIDQMNQCKKDVYVKKVVRKGSNKPKKKIIVDLRR